MFTTKSAQLTDEQKAELDSMIEDANGLRRTRIVKSKSTIRFLELLAEHFDTAKSIRVYSSDGFVAKSYKYRADITFIQASRTDDGWNIYAGTGDAKRGYGAGSLVTIDGRAA